MKVLGAIGVAVGIMAVSPAWAAQNGQDNRGAQSAWGAANDANHAYAGADFVFEQDVKDAGKLMNSFWDVTGVSNWRRACDAPCSDGQGSSPVCKIAYDTASATLGAQLKAHSTTNNIRCAALWDTYHVRSTGEYVSAKGTTAVDACAQTLAKSCPLIQRRLKWAKLSQHIAVESKHLADLRTKQNDANAECEDHPDQCRADDAHSSSDDSNPNGNQPIGGPESPAQGAPPAQP